VKIVHLITTLGVGGAEKHLLWLGAGQRAAGHDVSVLYLKGEGELAGEFEAAGMPVRKMAFEGLGDLRSALSGIARQLKAERPDVLHTHLLKADALGALVGHKSGVPVVVSSKHNDERALLRRGVGLIHGWLSRRVDRVIALSDHVARFVARHGHVRHAAITRIYYGVDAEALAASRSRGEVRAELGLDESTRVLVCVGRLAPQKDHPTLLRALALLPPDVELLVVGGDPFGDGRERLQALAQELGVTDRAHFLGIRHDVPDLLGASDLFVLPSLWEGLGLVFLEAMAVRLPIVASNVSAIPEVVQDGVSGWLVVPGNPQALADAVKEACAHDADRLARGLAGHMRLLERFALPRMIQETLELYESALSAKGRPS
jgi:glycosyltransferase involved in cell wall biosynthesis